MKELYNLRFDKTQFYDIVAERAANIADRHHHTATEICAAYKTAHYACEVGLTPASSIDAGLKIAVAEKKIARYLLQPND